MTAPPFSLAIPAQLIIHYREAALGQPAAAAAARDAETRRRKQRYADARDAMERAADSINSAFDAAVPSWPLWPGSSPWAMPIPASLVTPVFGEFVDDLRRPPVLPASAEEVRLPARSQWGYSFQDRGERFADGVDLARLSSALRGRDRGWQSGDLIVRWKGPHGCVVVALGGGRPPRPLLPRRAMRSGRAFLGCISPPSVCCLAAAYTDDAQTLPPFSGRPPGRPPHRVAAALVNNLCARAGMQSISSSSPTSSSQEQHADSPPPFTAAEGGARARRRPPPHPQERHAGGGATAAGG